jgi:hypothetical protein
MKQLKLYEKLNENNTFTFTTKEPSDEIRYIFKKVADSDQLRSDNYIIDSKEIMNNTLCYTVTSLDGEPVLASLAWTRPMFNGIIRLCTRYCIDPAYSHKNFGKGTDGMRLDTMDHIIQQIEFCEALGHKDFFIGREDKSSGRRSRKIAKVISNYTNKDWKVSDKPVLVTPSPNNPHAWQYVIYNTRENFDYENILPT